jgi:dipeptidyl aminopeptidase/acylaminoacyl peptidase
MMDIHDTLERESERYAIRHGAFERMSRRRDRKQRNQRIGAAVVGLTIAIGIGIAVAVLASVVLRSEREPQPADRTRIVHEGEVLEVDADRLVATDTMTGDQRTLARCRDCFFPFRKYSASVDRRWIAYSSITCHLSCGHAEPAGGIWVAGAAGPPVLVGGSWLWAWSPTTDQLAFVGDSKDGTELALFDPASGERTSVVTTRGGIIALAWSPDGSTIAYVANTRSEPSKSTIVVVRPGATPKRIGEPRVLLSPSSAWGALDAMNGFDELVWSPDGTRLALSTSRDGLIVVPIDGSGEWTVIDEHPGSFAWSPDGRQIAYKDARGVVIVPASGGTPVHFGSDTFSPIDRYLAERWIQARANWFLSFGGGIVWSPDGKLIAFTQGLSWKAVPVG